MCYNMLILPSKPTTLNVDYKQYLVKLIFSKFFKKFRLDSVLKINDLLTVYYFK